MQSRIQSIKTVRCVHLIIQHQHQPLALGMKHHRHKTVAVRISRKFSRYSACIPAKKFLFRGSHITALSKPRLASQTGYFSRTFQKPYSPSFGTFHRPKSSSTEIPKPRSQRSSSFNNAHLAGSTFFSSKSGLKRPAAAKSSTEGP